VEVKVSTTFGLDFAEAIEELTRTSILGSELHLTAPGD
jgi:hypothetical protein